MNREPVNSAEEARSKAIDWQVWAGEQSLGYGDYAEWADYFRQLGEQYDLTEEFEENGII